MKHVCDLIAIKSTVHVYKVNKSKITNMVADVLELLGIEAHFVSISFVGSSNIRTLNKQFRNKDRSTDVLSFPQKVWNTLPSVKRKGKHRPLSVEYSEVLGDVVISLPDASVNARKIGQSLDREVAFLLIHGLLHLCGYDHLSKSDEDRMVSEQKLLMASLSKCEGSKPFWHNCVKPI